MSPIELSWTAKNNRCLLASVSACTSTTCLDFQKPRNFHKDELLVEHLLEARWQEKLSKTTPRTCLRARAPLATTFTFQATGVATTFICLESFTANTLDIYLSRSFGFGFCSTPNLSRHDFQIHYNLCSKPPQSIHVRIGTCNVGD